MDRTLRSIPGLFPESGDFVTTRAQLNQKALIVSVLRDLEQIAIPDSVRAMDSILHGVNNVDDTPIETYNEVKRQWARLGVKLPNFPLWVKLGAEVHTRLIVQHQL